MNCVRSIANIVNLLPTTLPCQAPRREHADRRPSMSLVPFRTSDPRRKRRTLDQAQVVRAALALLDEVGLDELTMRRLAERLGVKAAALYRHVRGKDELLALL